MLCQRIDLYEHFGIQRPDNAKGYLDAYIRNFDNELKTTEANAPERKRPAMLIIAGGAYRFTSGREKEPVAINYMDMGFHTFVLDYSVAPVCYPTQLIEACMAMLFIRECESSFNVDGDHVCAIGFSAGGHLCGMLATMYNAKQVVDVLGDNAKLCRPDAVILSYPVISSGEYAHKNSFNNLCDNDEDLARQLSLEFNVTNDAPPAFIWATNNDKGVPCENSLLMAMAYRKAGVPMELHIFEQGGHGLSTCDEEVWVNEPSVRQWIKLSKVWLKNRGFEVKNFWSNK